MGKHEKVFKRVLMRSSDANIPFGDLCALLRRLGFTERTRGDHHIFTMDDVEEILNLQPWSGKAKPYQVRQVRDMILKYNRQLGE